MPDNIKGLKPVTNSWSWGLAITPHDTNDLVQPVNAIYVGAAGNLTVILRDQSTTTDFPNLPVGFHPIACSRVLATGTTATGIRGLL